MTASQLQLHITNVTLLIQATRNFFLSLVEFIPTGSGNQADLVAVTGVGLLHRLARKLRKLPASNAVLCSGFVYNGRYVKTVQGLPSCAIVKELIQ